MSRALRIGLAGLGTVGSQVAESVLSGVIPGVSLSAVCAREARGFGLSDDDRGRSARPGAA